MDKRILLESGGFPVYIRDLVALQDNMLATIIQLTKALIGSSNTGGVMLWGELTHNGNTWTVTQGAVYLNGDIYPVEAGSINLQDGENAMLAVIVSLSDVRVYKDYKEHPAEASYKAVLTTSTDNAYTYMPCTSIGALPRYLRDIIDEVSPQYTTVALTGTDHCIIESDGLQIQMSSRDNSKEVRIKGDIIIRSLTDSSELATYPKQGIKGCVYGILESLAKDFNKRLVVVEFAEGNSANGGIYLYEADGTLITNLVNGMFGYVLHINGFISFTE